MLPNNIYIVRNSNSNNTSFPHGIRFRNYIPEKPPPLLNNYQEAQWQVDDINIVPQDGLYTVAWEAEIGGHLFDISFIYTDPNASDFEEKHSQGPDTVTFPRSFFHGLSPNSSPSSTHEKMVSALVNMFY